MKKIIILLVLSIGIISCQKDKVITNPISQVQSIIKRTNSDNNYKSTAANALLIRKSSNWKEQSDGSVQLHREAHYNLELSNGEIV
jgi:hypothetical protein